MVLGFLRRRSSSSRKDLTSSANSDEASEITAEASVEFRASALREASEALRPLLAEKDAEIAALRAENELLKARIDKLSGAQTAPAPAHSDKLGSSRPKDAHDAAANSKPAGPPDRDATAAVSVALAESSATIRRVLADHAADLKDDDALGHIAARSTSPAQQRDGGDDAPAAVSVSLADSAESIRRALADHTADLKDDDDALKRADPLKTTTPAQRRDRGDDAAPAPADSAPLLDELPPEPVGPPRTAEELAIMEQQRVQKLHEEWDYLGGAEVEPLLRSGAVALLDAKWLVDRAAKGLRIERRQDLPPEAFISLDDLKAVGCVRGGLPIVLLSYTWLHPSHPDPQRTTLNLVAFVLEAYLENRGYDVNDGRRWGVFWDYASLHQHHPDGTKRSVFEEGLFKHGLQGLGRIYSHPRTTVFRCTRMPDTWPAQYDLPAGANMASYEDRGWCMTEAAWSSLVKDFDFNLDLGKLGTRESTKREIVETCTSRGARRPPLTPEQFTAEVAVRSFTNGSTDKPIVCRLYREVHDERLGTADSLAYANLGWDAAEACQLAKVIASGATPKLVSLNLSANRLGDGGMSALAAAFASVESPSGKPVVPALESLDLRDCRIGESGMQALASAIGDGALPAIKTITLAGNPASDAPVRKALRKRQPIGSTARRHASPASTARSASPSSPAPTRPAARSARAAAGSPSAPAKPRTGSPATSRIPVPANSARNANGKAPNKAFLALGGSDAPDPTFKL